MKNKVFSALSALCTFSILMALSAPLASMVSAQVTTAQVDPRVVGSTSDLDINSDGSVTLDGAYVQEIAGTTFYTSIHWGSSFLRVLLLTDTATNFTKKFGGSINRSEVSPGDFISVTGTLNTGAGTLEVQAATFKDWSIQTQSDQFSGTVTALSGNAQPGFTLTISPGNSILVNFATSSQILKGALVLTPWQVSVGDKITTATGLYDHSTNTLTASAMVIYQDMSIFQPQNFQGKLVSLSGQTLPATMVIMVNNQQYTVNLPAGMSVLNNVRQTVSLGRFLSGDTVRVYGSIEQANHFAIDASILRDTSI